MSTPAHHHAGRPTRPIMSRASFLRGGGAILAGLALPGAARAAAAPAMADHTVVVDLGTPTGRPAHRATGFLNGLSQDGASPGDELLRPLKPRLFRGGGSLLDRGWGGRGEAGYLPRWQYVADTYARVAAGPYDAEYCIVIPDLWGAEGVTLGRDDEFPGDGGDWTNWERFLTRVVSDVKAAGMRPDRVQYEIWNEPDYTAVYFPRPKEQYEELWRRGVRLIRALDPQARIVGPTFTRITTTDDSWHMDDWLDMVVASDTAPDILSWHDLIPGKDPVDQADLARDLLAERGLEQVLLELNEYPSNVGLDPGYNAWYVARFERSGIDYGVLAIFGACCMYPQLDGLLTQEGDELYRNGRWWAYERYGSLEGQLVAVRPDDTMDAVAGLDRRARRARIVLGNGIGDGSDLGTVRVELSGLARNRAFLAPGGRVPVRVERIPDAAKLEAPEVVSDREVPFDGDRLDVDIDWTDANSAYVVTLGRQDSELPPFVIVGIDPAAPVLLPDRPTTLSVTLRNYTDAPIAVPVSATVPAGYDVASAAEALIPANADAVVELTVTRAAGAASGTLGLRVGEFQRSVPLEASDNWARIAAVRASSTHAPSSAANLNDGDTDSERWGGGGAGGWNDDTVGAFPDTVTATWDAPVPLSRIVVHTLDSAAYPASAWGVRDIDVVVVAGGVSQTVAQVRGNTSGVIEASFDAVQAERVDIVILASNSDDYSRLMEIEAFS